MHVLGALLLLLSPICLAAQNEWRIAEERIVRLKPSDFPQLPRAIVRDLERRRCRIPQTIDSRESHNVIKGSFAKKGQTDWAILCSRNGRSSILVYWNGSIRMVGQIGAAADSSYLQTVDGNGAIGYSREIRPVSRETILASYHSYGGPRPPKPSHDGIDDIFQEKASVILYYHRGRWIELRGSD